MVNTTLMPVIPTATLNQIGFEDKTAEAIQILAHGSQLTRKDLQEQLKMSQPGLAQILKNLTIQGVTVETVQYDGPDGKRQTHFTLNPQGLRELVDRRIDELRQVSLRLEKIFGGSARPSPAPEPELAPTRSVAPSVSRPVVPARNGDVAENPFKRPPVDQNALRRR